MNLVRLGLADAVGVGHVMALHNGLVASLGLAVHPGGQIRRTVRPVGGVQTQFLPHTVATCVYLGYCM